MTEQHSNKIKSLREPDYATCAMVLAHEARRWVGEGDMKRAEECLTVQQRILIGAGSKDVGPIIGVRDLPENIYQEKIEKEQQIEQLHDEIDRLHQEIERRKADLNSSSIKERILNIFK